MPGFLLKVCLLNYARCITAYRAVADTKPALAIRGIYLPNP